MKATFTSLCMVLALIAGTARDRAQAAPVFPISTNVATLVLGDGIACDGSNYLVGLLVATNLNMQLVAANGTLIGPQIDVSGSSSALAMGGPVFLGTNYLVTWSETPVVSNVNIFGQLISRSGVKTGASFNLLQTLGAHGAQIAKALGTDGTNFLAVWQDDSNLFYYGQFITPTGGLSGSEFLISSQPLNGGSASVAFAKTNYLVVWDSDNGVSGHAAVYGALVATNGSVGNPFQISQTPYADEKVVDAMSVVFNGSNFLSAWMWNPGPEKSGTLTNWQIYGRVISPAGALPGNELILTSNRNQALPALAFDGANYLLAYGFDSNTTNSDANIYCQFLDPLGNPAGPTFTPFTAMGTNLPLLVVNGVVFDGTRFAVAGSLGSVLGNSSEIFGTFIPSEDARASPRWQRRTHCRLAISRWS